MNDVGNNIGSDGGNDAPASQAMDSTWFALDQNGHIAVFDTGEAGATPASDSFPRGGKKGGTTPLEPTTLLAHVLWARAEHDERLRALMPAKKSTLMAWLDKRWPQDPGALFRHLGVFTYFGGNDGFATPYERDGPVSHPLVVRLLDASIQSHFEDASLPVSFARAAHLAPGEHTAVRTWGSVWYGVDGRVNAAAGESLPPGAQDWAAAFTDDMADNGDDFVDATAFYASIAKALDGVRTFAPAVDTSAKAPPSDAPTGAAIGAPRALGEDKTSFGAFLRRLSSDK